MEGGEAAALEPQGPRHADRAGAEAGANAGPIREQTNSPFMVAESGPAGSAAGASFAQASVA